MFIVTLTYLKPVEEIDALMHDHVAWLKKGYADGLFIASGRQVPRTGGVILARSGDEQACARTSRATRSWCTAPRAATSWSSRPA